MGGLARLGGEGGCQVLKEEAERVLFSVEGEGRRRGWLVFLAEEEAGDALEAVERLLEVGGSEGGGEGLVHGWLL